MRADDPGPGGSVLSEWLGVLVDEHGEHRHAENYRMWTLEARVVFDVFCAPDAPRRLPYVQGRDVGERVGARCRALHLQTFPAPVDLVGEPLTPNAKPERHGHLWAAS